jgi:uncharacterized membrane protein
MSAAKLISSAISAILALNLASTQNAFAEAQKDNNIATDSKNQMMSMDIPGMEKCYGIAKAGMNDCHNALHQCGGEAKIDANKEDYVLVPQGLCNKIVGAVKTPSLPTTTEKTKA